LVRREHTFGSDWIKTTNTGGYFSAGDDPARVTWFDDEMEVLTATARQLSMPVAVHTGAADGCKQAIRFGARSIEHAYLIDSEGLQMAEKAGALASSDYGLLDENTFAPRPNYWAALLWRKLMGATVLKPGVSPGPNRQLYAQCLRDVREGWRFSPSIRIETLLKNWRFQLIRNATR
jgi:imidazolonepropionase-like amidohydrolase